VPATARRYERGERYHCQAPVTHALLLCADLWAADSPHVPVP
jgi:hypothetical protein